MTTERFALKQVFNVFAPICGGRMFMNRNKLLNFFKGVIINHAFAQAGNDFAFIAILADIGGINERTGKGITGKGQAARGFYAAPGQLVDDFLHGHAGGILLEHVTNMGRCFLVNNELAVYRLITIGDRASAEAALGDGFTLATLDFLFEIKRIIFGRGFEQRFKQDGFVTFADVLHDGEDTDAVLLELVLINRGIITAAGKAVEFPDKDTLELFLRGIGNHTLEIGAFISRAGNGTVNVFADDGQITALCVCVTIAKLTFDRLFGLIMRRVAGINHSVHKKSFHKGFTAPPPLCYTKRGGGTSGGAGVSLKWSAPVNAGAVFLWVKPDGIRISKRQGNT